MAGYLAAMIFGEFFTLPGFCRRTHLCASFWGNQCFLCTNLCLSFFAALNPDHPRASPLARRCSRLFCPRTPQSCRYLLAVFRVFPALLHGRAKSLLGCFAGNPTLCLSGNLSGNLGVFGRRSVATSSHVIPTGRDGPIFSNQTNFCLMQFVHAGALGNNINDGLAMLPPSAMDRQLAPSRH